MNRAARIAALRLAGFVAAFLLWALVAPAAAAPSLQLSEHGRFSRAEWDFSHRPAVTMQSMDGIVRLRFPAEGQIPGSAGRVHGIAAVAGGRGEATLRVAPGALVHLTRLGHRVIVDVWPVAEPLVQGMLRPAAPLPARAAAGPAAPGPPSTPSATPSPSAQPPDTAVKPPMRASAVAPAPATGAPGSASDRGVSTANASAGPPAPGTPPGSAGDGVGSALPPAPPAVRRLDGEEAAILVPAPPGTGAAAFRRGQDAVIVLDAPLTLALDALAGDAVFGGATAVRLPQATILRLPLADADGVSLSRLPEGWRVAIGKPVPAAMPIEPQTADAILRLPCTAPAGTVVIPDPLTGDDLLVGTLRTGGESVAVARQSPFFTLLPTVLGVAVLPATDRVDLRSAPSGFTLAATEPPALALADSAQSDSAIAAASTLTRRFDLPDSPADMLMRALDSQIAEAASLPRRDRLAPRLRAAETMLALGMGKEAQAMVAAAGADAPQAAADPTARALAAAAAWVAGRLPDSAPLDDPALGGSDEVVLWRALRQGASAATADSFAATWPLALAYPEALQRRILPVIAEALADAGRAAPLSALLARAPRLPSLDLARAIMAARDGQTDAALALLDPLRLSDDRSLAVRASIAATELRLRTGKIDEAGAEAALERLLFAWRGDERELTLRLRVAELQTHLGRARDAFALLQDSEALFPADLAKIRAREAALLAALAGPAGAAMKPLDLAAMLEDATPLLADPDVARALAPRLADTLLALDLPERALPILRGMMQRVAEPAPRAELGQRVAALLLDAGDADGAMHALQDSDAPGLAPPLLAARELLRARGLAAHGDTAGALAALAPLDAPAALDLRAGLLAAAGDWRGAEAALSSLAATIPPTGPIGAAQQAVLLRLASAAEQAGDTAMLQRLAAGGGDRLPPGTDQAAFRMLTAAPVRASTDLPRAAAELRLARALPAPGGASASP